MKTKFLISGNEAIAEGAIKAGCRFFAGYPITPQNEIPAYMARRMPEVNGSFIQSESEISAISMVMGASAAGIRALTTSSSPGISLKQEGISYLAGAELPAVIANIMRAGPGLANIWPAQSDYFQATKGGGHGDYHNIVFAPSTVQEAFDLMQTAFDLSDKYRNPAMILADGMLGQMMEPISFETLSPEMQVKKDILEESVNTKPWSLTGCTNREPNVIASFKMRHGETEEHNNHLKEKYDRIQRKEQRYEAMHIKGSDVIIVAYGTMARIAKGAIKVLRSRGKKIGLIRPITLWPFPKKVFRGLFRNNYFNGSILVIEMSSGQMVEDVQLAVSGKCPVRFFGKTGGGIPTEKEIVNRVNRLLY